MSMSSLSSNPLFSSLFAFSVLILLYFPRLLWTFLFSPVFLLTAFLFLSLLRLGATHQSLILRQQTHHKDPLIQTLLHTDQQHHGRGTDHAVPLPKAEGDGPDVSCACFEESFVQWNVRAPLEVIYEDYEEEEEGEDDVSNETDPPFTETEPQQVRIGIGIQRYPSLSLYYPETDSETSSDDEFPTPGAWDSLDSMCFMWDHDEDRDELIEIALDNTNNINKPSAEFQFEEDNLIEINISPTRNNHHFPHLKSSPFPPGEVN